jgi:hypothetical protein
MPIPSFLTLVVPLEHYANRLRSAQCVVFPSSCFLSLVCPVSPLHSAPSVTPSGLFTLMESVAHFGSRLTYAVASCIQSLRSEDRGVDGIKMDLREIGWGGGG